MPYGRIKLVAGILSEHYNKEKKKGVRSWEDKTQADQGKKRKREIFS